MDHHTKINPAVSPVKKSPVQYLITHVSPTVTHMEQQSLMILKTLFIFFLLSLVEEGSSAGKECYASIVMLILIDIEAIAVGSLK